MTSLTAFADLSLHYVGEEGLLLDPENQRLYALNATAAFIWSLLKDGKSLAEVSRVPERAIRGASRRGSVLRSRCPSAIPSVAPGRQAIGS